MWWWMSQPHAMNACAGIVHVLIAMIFWLSQTLSSVVEQSKLMCIIWCVKHWRGRASSGDSSMMAKSLPRMPTILMYAGLSPMRPRKVSVIPISASRTVPTTPLFLILYLKFSAPSKLGACDTTALILSPRRSALVRTGATNLSHAIRTWKE